MSKYHGEIGFVNNVETSPGIWETDNMTVREYYGDVIKAIRRLEISSEQINSNPTTNVEISIIGDTYAFEHMYDMRYAVYKGIKWTISSADVREHRIVLSLGGIYNGG